MGGNEFQTSVELCSGHVSGGMRNSGNHCDLEMYVILRIKYMFIY